MKISGQLLFLFALLTAHVAAIPLTQFYPFGKEAGDILLPRNDDGSSDAVLLSPQFTFFGQQFDNIYVSFIQAGTYFLFGMGEGLGMRLLIITSVLAKTM